MNGAGTGAEAYQTVRQVQARLRAPPAVFAAALGTATTTPRGLPAGTTTTRAAARTALASALFATPTSVG